MNPGTDKLDQMLITGGGLYPEPAGPPEDWSGRTLGAFELQELIGTGGMATVYRARRADEQFQQQVAIKVLGEQFGGEEHLQRFLRERQILADLDHPGIARIIDGGVEQSRPYLVMDLVSGLPLNEYCQQNQPSPQARLTLFEDICRAVQHAHSKGVVHQDLKPGNVLITAEGQPRLLDFGIATVHGATEDDASRLFTPRFAAPEQFQNQPTSTATDVFQLGLLLHYIYTGGHAFADKDAGVATLREAVVSGAPRPLSALAGVSSSWQRDLNAIIHRCLQASPDDRYPSVAHLLDDIKALGENQPLSSRSHQPIYRLGKFSNRHRLALAFTAVAAVLAVLGGAAIWRQMEDQRAQAAASARNSATLGEVVSEILDSVDPLNGNSQMIGEVITASGFELSAATNDQPAVQRELVLRSGRTMLDLGRFDDVVRMVEPLVQELAQLPSPPPRYAEYLSLLGYARYRAGHLEQGLAELKQALAYQDDRLATPADARAQTLQRLALAQRRAAAFDLALANIQRALELLPADKEQWAVQRAQALSQRGLIYTDIGTLDLAVASFEESLAGYDRLPGDHSLRRAMTLSNLADAQRLQGQLDPARSNARKSVELLNPLYEENPRLVATARITLGNVAMAATDYAGAATEYRTALETYQQELGAAHPRVALVSHNLATALRLAGDCPGAIAYYDQSIAIASNSYPADHPELAETRRQRALCVPGEPGG